MKEMGELLENGQGMLATKTFIPSFVSESLLSTAYLTIDYNLLLSYGLKHNVGFIPFQEFCCAGLLLEAASLIGK